MSDSFLPPLTSQEAIVDKDGKPTIYFQRFMQQLIAGENLTVDNGVVSAPLPNKLSVIPNDEALGQGFANIGLDNNDNRYKGLFLSASGPIPRPGSGGGGPVVAINTAGADPTTGTGYLYVQNDDGTIFAGFPDFDPTVAGGVFSAFGTHPWLFELPPLVGSLGQKIYYEGNLSFGSGLTYNVGTGVLTASGGGGGTPWYFKPPLAANFSTMYASLRAGSILNAFTVTDDADVGMAYVDNSADVGYMKAMGRPIPAAFIGGNFTITARMTANSYTANDQWGIWVRASATKYIFFDLFNRGGTMNIQRAFYNAAWNDGSFSLSWESPEIWLRIVVNNQTTSYWVSADGKHWTQCYASENLFAASFTDYGFCMGRFSTTAKWFITCDSFTSDEYP